MYLDEDDINSLGLDLILKHCDATFSKSITTCITAFKTNRKIMPFV